VFIQAFCAEGALLSSGLPAAPCFWAWAPRRVVRRLTAVGCCRAPRRARAVAWPRAPASPARRRARR